VRGFDQNEASRIETEGVEAMTVKPAVFAASIGRHDEEQRFNPRQMGKESGDETEGGGGRAFFGHDLMQSAAGQAAVWQVPIDG
jgi:hypothetical protein